MICRVLKFLILETEIMLWSGAEASAKTTQKAFDMFRIVDLQMFVSAWESSGGSAYSQIIDESYSEHPSSVKAL